MDIEKDVSFLNEKVQQWNKNYNHYFANDITDEIDKENKAIEHILSEREQDKKRIKELEEEVKNEIKARDILVKLNEDSIPVQKVKDKIEELDNLQKEMTTKNHNADNINDCYRYGDEAQKAMYKKEALKELLEEK